MNLSSNLQSKLIPSLKSDEVHIWSACFSDNEKDINYLSSLLSEDEHQRANRFRFPKDQKSFTISRGILRCLLGRYLGQAPQSIEIMYGLGGKPCVLAEKSLHFNLSHSRDHALYAVTRGYEVGIDLEYINENLELDDMALSILSAKELDYWRTVKPEEKVDVFFKLWVTKEAFLKTSGKGWLNNQQAIPLEGLDVLKKENRKNTLNERMTSPYLFESIPGYASALYIEGPPLRPLHFM